MSDDDQLKTSLNPIKIILSRVNKKIDTLVELFKRKLTDIKLTDSEENKSVDVEFRTQEFQTILHRLIYMDFERNLLLGLLAMAQEIDPSERDSLNFSPYLKILARLNSVTRRKIKAIKKMLQSVECDDCLAEITLLSNLFTEAGTISVTQNSEFNFGLVQKGKISNEL